PPSRLVLSGAMSVEPISAEPPSRLVLSGAISAEPMSEDPSRRPELPSGAVEPSSGARSAEPPAVAPAEPVNGSRMSPKSGSPLWAAAVPVAVETASAAAATTAAALVDNFIRRDPFGGAPPVEPAGVPVDPVGNSHESVFTHIRVH